MRAAGIKTLRIRAILLYQTDWGGEGVLGGGSVYGRKFDAFQFVSPLVSSFEKNSAVPGRWRTSELSELA